MAMDQLAGWDRRSFDIDGVTREVLCKGTGPGVIVIAEIPGITPKVIEFSERVLALGCTVWMPVLFGEPGRRPSGSYAVQSIVPACVSKEFSAFATGRTSPGSIRSPRASR